MTIGSRYLGANYYDLPLITRLGEAVMEKLIQIFFKSKIMNNQNGFRAFNRKIIPLFNDTKYLDYTSATEIILKTALKGYRIKECPIKLYHRQFGSSGIYDCAQRGREFQGGLESRLGGLSFSC